MAKSTKNPNGVVLRRMRPVALARGVPPQDVDDIVHDAVVRLLSRPPDGPVRNAEARAIAVLCQQCRTAWRSRSLRNARWANAGPAECIAAPPDCEGHARLELTELMGRVEAFAARQDEMDRAILDGLVGTKAAGGGAAEKLSAPARRKRLSRLRRRFAAFLDECEPDR